MKTKTFFIFFIKLKNKILDLVINNNIGMNYCQV